MIESPNPCALPPAVASALREGREKAPSRPAALDAAWTTRDIRAVDRLIPIAHGKWSSRLFDFSGFDAPPAVEADSVPRWDVTEDVIIEMAVTRSSVLDADRSPLAPRLRYEFTIERAHVLEEGDAIWISDPRVGLEKCPARILRIEPGPKTARIFAAGDPLPSASAATTSFSVPVDGLLSVHGGKPIGVHLDSLECSGG